MRSAVARPYLLVICFALVPRVVVAQTECQEWCDTSEQPNELKCSMDGCSGCSFCEPVCIPQCDKLPAPWAEKCSWNECLECPICKSTTFLPVVCPQWCTRVAKPDAEKCTFDKCSACSFCESISGRDSSCPPFCQQKSMSWTAKCNLIDCSGCGECSEVTLTADILLQAPQEPTTVERPNILLILGDDVGTGDIPGYWGKDRFMDGLVDMPNLQDLVEKGVLFTDAHATPQCATSRYLLLSGNYPHRGRSGAGTWHMGLPSQFINDQQSLAQVLRDGGGYHTAMMGKWHLGGLIPGADNQTSGTASDILKNPQNDWTKPLVEGPQTLGFDSSLITDKGIQSTPYAFFQDGYLTTDIDDVRVWQVGEYDMPFGRSKISVTGQGDKGWDSTAYNMILVNETNRFLDDHYSTRPDDPFFAYVALGATHEPHSPPTSYIDGEPVAGVTDTDFLDMLKEMDLVVGSLVGSIERRGIAENTIIIFTSDNGGLPNARTESEGLGHYTQGPLYSYKGSVSEGGHRVPLIMRYNGVFPAGEQRSQLVGINDLFATVCEIAGVDIPSGTGTAVDSVSFADYIASNDNSGLREFFGVWRDEKSGVPRSRALRYNNYILKYQIKRNDTILHDLDTDLGEQNDISSEPEFEGLIKMMHAELLRLRPE